MKTTYATDQGLTAAGTLNNDLCDAVVGRLRRGKCRSGGQQSYQGSEKPTARLAEPQSNQSVSGPQLRPATFGSLLPRVEVQSRQRRKNAEHHSLSVVTDRREQEVLELGI